MAELATIARPYAEALFRVAKAGSLAAWSDLVDEMAQVAKRYARRSGPERYSLLQPDVWQLVQERQRAILGGGCAYTGRDMKSAHAGLGIARSQFNALVEDLQVAMDKRGIPFRAQNQLLAKLAPMHREVETR